MMAIGRDGLGARWKTRAGCGPRGRAGALIASILLCGALALPALPVHADATLKTLDLATLNLLRAALDGTASEVKAALSAGADLGGRMESGATPLHLAAAHNPSVIAALLKAGADPGARTEHGVTPLHWAVQSGKPSVILALIEAGADPGARMERDETPLPPHLAAAANLAAGITPLHWAAGKNDNPSVILALIEGGADPGARDDAGRTPFDYAKDNEVLKGTEAYWLLNEARFE